MIERTMTEMFGCLDPDCYGCEKCEIPHLDIDAIHAKAVIEARKRISKFCHEYLKMGGLDKEEIYGLHGGVHGDSERSCALLVSDLKLLSQPLPSEHKPDVVKQLIEALQHSREIFIQLGVIVNIKNIMKIESALALAEQDKQ